MDWMKQVLELDKDIEQLERRLLKTEDGEEELHIILELEGKFEVLKQIIPKDFQIR